MSRQRLPLTPSLIHQSATPAPPMKAIGSVHDQQLPMSPVVELRNESDTQGWYHLSCPPASSSLQIAAGRAQAADVIECHANLDACPGPFGQSVHEAFRDVPPMKNEASRLIVSGGSDGLEFGLVKAWTIGQHLELLPCSILASVKKASSAQKSELSMELRAFA